MGLKCKHHSAIHICRGHHMHVATKHTCSRNITCRNSLGQHSYKHSCRKITCAATMQQTKPTWTAHSWTHSSSHMQNRKQKIQPSRPIIRTSQKQMHMQMQKVSDHMTAHAEK
ncbi:hypothetical protein I3760_01G109100 [Carya illinoinensis]|nr:hypothetical protein I3760_01G109100 [Carya illinoinensis]